MKNGQNQISIRRYYTFPSQLHWMYKWINRSFQLYHSHLKFNTFKNHPDSFKQGNKIQLPVKTSSSLPGLSITRSLALYWSPCAWRPIMIGLVHPGTSRGMFLHTIGSRKTVPPRIFLIVPFGLSHIFFNLNSKRKRSMVRLQGALFYFE